MGDEICAWIKLKQEYENKIKKEDIIAYCKGKIAHFKILPMVVFKLVANGIRCDHSAYWATTTARISQF